MTSAPRLPELGKLSIREQAPSPHSDATSPLIPADITGSDDRGLQKLKNYARFIPYGIESNARLQEMLDFIVVRMVQCVEAKDYDPGLLQWDSMLT
jgi:proteasome activator subunit 4